MVQHKKHFTLNTIENTFFNYVKVEIDRGCLREKMMHIYVKNIYKKYVFIIFLTIQQYNFQLNIFNGQSKLLRTQLSHQN